MAIIHFGEVEVNTSGELPSVGSSAIDFTLTGVDLTDIRLEDYRGKAIVLNIFPSVDTPTCQASVREFNKRATEIGDAKVLCVAKDLPFAMARFCGAEGLASVISASGFRSSFGDAYGVEMVDGVLRGLYARAVVVINAEGVVVFSQLVDQLGEEPNYDDAIDALY